MALFSSTGVAGDVDTEDVRNTSAVTGGNVKDALNTLNNTKAERNELPTVEERTKLANIEEGATADPEPFEVRDLYEQNVDVNRLSDARLEKLNGVQTEATKNATDAALRDRSTHQGTQPQGSIEGLAQTFGTKADLDPATGALRVDQVPAEVGGAYVVSESPTEVVVEFLAPGERGGSGVSYDGGTAADW